MKVFIFLFFQIILCLTAFGRVDSTASRGQQTPIILVPGDASSQIYGKYSKPDIFCPGALGSKWFRIWLNLGFLLPFTEHCLLKYFKLNYNRKTRKTYNNAGVTTAIRYWGDTKAIEILNSNKFGWLSKKYYYNLVTFLVQKGYVRNKSIRGAPYDFRKAPNDNMDFVPNMKALVEQTYQINGNKRVMILAHSLGNLYTLFFLRKMTAAWKKKFVRGYMAVSGPIAGTVKSLQLMTSGDTLSKFVVFKSYMRDVERSMPSTPFLFPSPKFWTTDEVLISRPSRNYTVKDYQQLFTDLKFPDGWEMYKDTSHLVDPHWKPDVDELYCFYGTGLPTAAKYVWKKDSDFPDKTPQAIIEDGDGTVNIRSLKVCNSWPNAHAQEFKGIQHQKILGEQIFIDAVYKILQQPERMKSISDEWL